LKWRDISVVFTVYISLSSLQTPVVDLSGPTSKGREGGQERKGKRILGGGREGREGGKG